MIAVPEIKSFKITKETDFIIIGSKFFRINLGDGIFDKINNLEIINGISTLLCEDDHHGHNINKLSGNVCDFVMKMSLSRNTIDNISCVFISFRKYWSNIIYLIIITE